MTATAPPALRAARVSIEFGGVRALADVDMTFAAASITGLIGPNGAGKSTLLAILSGLLQPGSGQVFMAGVDVTHLSAHQRARRGLARTFQHPEVFAGLTVRDHLLLGDRVRHSRSRIVRDAYSGRGLRRPTAAEVDRVAGLVDLLGLSALIDRDVAELPLGTTRLVEVGRALATEPTVLLLDEPFSGLDERETARLAETLVAVHADRTVAMILVEHDVEKVLEMSREVHVMDAGRRIAVGPPETIRDDASVQEAFLGTVKSLAVAVAEPANNATSHAAVPARPLLSVHGLSVNYGPARALIDVSFGAGEGSGLAVLGANGAGKSTLARAISRLIPVEGGSVHFAGQDITRHSPHRVRRAGLVYLPEGRGVFPGLSIRDNLEMAVATLPRSERPDAIARAVEAFPRLGDRLRQLAGRLSGGEQQMLSVARAVAVRPKLIIGDELSLGLAPLIVDAVFAGLASAMEDGTTVILIEQFVERAIALTGQCIILQRGRVCWSGASADVGAEVLDRYLGANIVTAPGT